MLSDSLDSCWLFYKFSVTIGYNLAIVKLCWNGNLSTSAPSLSTHVRINSINEKNLEYLRNFVVETGYSFFSGIRTKIWKTTEYFLST